MADDRGRRECLTLALAVPPKAKGLVVSALPPGRMQDVTRLSWGQLARALAARRWPALALRPASSLAAFAESLQAAVDRAAGLGPEAKVADLAAGDGPLPGTARLATAVLFGLNANGEAGYEAVVGPGHRPCVRSTWGLGAFSARAELSLGASGAQIALLVVVERVWGPTWRRRHSDPCGYAKALSRVVAVANEALAQGGWLHEASGVLRERGFCPVEGQPDRLLLRWAGVRSTLLLRPPSAAGLLWLAPPDGDLGTLVAAMAELSRVACTRSLQRELYECYGGLAPAERRSHAHRRPICAESRGGRPT